MSLRFFKLIILTSAAMSVQPPAFAQHLPGADGAPDYVRPFRMMQRGLFQSGQATAFTPPQNMPLDTTPNNSCASANFRQIVSDALHAQATGMGRSSPRQEELKDQRTDEMLSAIHLDNSAAAQTLQKEYHQLPTEQRLGTLQFCESRASDSRVPLHAALFADQGSLKGGFTVSGIGWPPYLFYTFGGLTQQRYKQLSQSLKNVASRPIPIVAGNDSSLCSNQKVRLEAMQAVADKVLMSGGAATPNMYADWFNKLRTDTSYVSGSILRAFKRQRPDFDTVEVCSVPFNQPGWLVTIVVRKGKRLGGSVGNFGMPGGQRYVRRLSRLRAAVMQ